MLSYLILASVLITCAQSANILVVAPVPAYSQFSIPFTLAKELARRGHQITCINAFPQKTKIANYTDVSVEDNIGIMEDAKKKLFGQAKKGILDNLSGLFDLTGILTESTLTNRNVRELLDSDKDFDLVIIEHFFNEAFICLGHYYNAPVVIITAATSGAMNNFIFANPTPVSYVAGSGAALTKHMNFWQRMQNLFMNSVFDALIYFYHLPKQERILKETLTSDVNLDDVLYNTSLMLANSHVSVSDAVPLVPNIVEIGGFHVNPKPLPKDLREFLDGAKDGLVLFSMGSNLRSDNLKPEVIEGILEAFSKIKQKVLWKFETDLLEVPENVKVMPWLPQQDVLAHPNIRAFITHGGFLSNVEAVYFGVPLIGVPVFGDQLHNVAAAVENGYAVHIALDNLDEESMSSALNEILTNPKYRENAQHRSKLMHDRPVKPIDLAVFWVEHILRHGGATHLRSAGLDLKWYQREMVDVLVFLTAIACTTSVIIYLFLKNLFRCIFSRKIRATIGKKTQ